MKGIEEKCGENLSTKGLPDTLEIMSGDYILDA